VGKYDTKTFRFDTIAVFPKLQAGSMAMWVDEAEGAVFFVSSGDVLRFPLGR